MTQVNCNQFSTCTIRISELKFFKVSKVQQANISKAMFKLSLSMNLYKYPITGAGGTLQIMDDHTFFST